MANESGQPDQDTTESVNTSPGLGLCPVCGNNTLQIRADFAVWCTFDNAFISADKLNLPRIISE